MLTHEQIAEARETLRAPDIAEDQIIPTLLAVTLVAREDREQALSRYAEVESELAETRLELSRVALSRNSGGDTIDPSILSEVANVAIEKIDVALSRGCPRPAAAMLRDAVYAGETPNAFMLSRQPDLNNLRIVDWGLKLLETAGFTGPLAKPTEKTGLQALARNIPDADGHKPDAAADDLPYKRMAERHNSQIKEPAKA